jgi:hypothetical protein
MRSHIIKKPDRESLSGVIIMSLLKCRTTRSADNYFFWMNISHIPLSSTFTVSMV